MSSRAPARRCVALALFMGAAVASGPCTFLNDCNGHGSCITSSRTCSCYSGWGAASDITLYRAADCSMRTCPADRAWVDIPTSSNTAHALAECSNAGLCDRATGQCKCFPGFVGDACQRCKCCLPRGVARAGARRHWGC
jgi:hypothetical protein